MDAPTNVTNDRNTAERVVQELMRLYPSANASFRVLPIIDREGGHFLLMDEGWQGHNRIHRIWAHIEVCCNKFYVHEDATEAGIANLIMDAGVGRERIVLALDPPVMRSAGAFAAA